MVVWARFVTDRVIFVPSSSLFWEFVIVPTGFVMIRTMFDSVHSMFEEVCTGFVLNV